MQQSVCASLARNHLWHMFCWHVKDNLSKIHRMVMFEALRHGKQEKRFAVLFPNFSKCATFWWHFCDLHCFAKTIFTISNYLHHNYV